MEKQPNNKQQVDERQQYKQLTSSELADLFNNYLGDSMYSCVFEHFLQVVKDDEIRDYIKFAQTISKRHLKEIEKIFRSEDIPVPVGFGEQDVRKDAPKLFGDLFMLFYTVQMTGPGALTYGSALTTATRHDVMHYFRQCIRDTEEMYARGVHLALAKGLDMAYPNIPYAKKVDFVEKKSFISLITGRDRPLLAMEIKHLQYNINTNILGKAIMLGFSQVASSETARKYFREGAQLSEKQFKQFGEYMTGQDLPTPKLVDAYITDSTTPPFSDKLMLYHTSLAGKIAMQNLGNALASMMRHDIAAEFGRLITVVGKFNNDGLNMLIEHGWLEEPFSAADRKELSKHSHGNE
ncbi:DUF3231 family protein [Virgibacillus kekensis]|uniref:DUF3231 family protein n=1 Tax=Virgibacillus kekensis TaxID=202261 RepID=A0ABV9DQ11_9BACI